MSQYHYGSYLDEEPPQPPSPFSLGPMAAEARKLGIAPPARALGADIAEVRARVLGGRKASEATPADHRAVAEELRERHQIDLNEEENLAHLEDPGLVAHMRSARSQLARHQEALARLPRRESLRTLHLDSVGAVSRQLREFDAYDMLNREQVEHAHRLARIIGDVARRRPIHGFSGVLSPAAAADPSVAKVLRHLQEKAEGVARAYEEAVDRVKAMKGEVFAARQKIERAGDGLLKLVEGGEEERRRLREYARLLGAKAGPPP